MHHAKNQSTLTTPVRSDESFEFELTDFDEARRVLDSESLSPFDVAAVVPPEHWQKVRRPKVPTDRALTGRAIDWLLRLPAEIRPQNLSARFPRIANALAEAWLDRAQFEAALHELLDDGRKGRQGFPPAVLAELQALRSSNAARPHVSSRGPIKTLG